MFLLRGYERIRASWPSPRRFRPWWLSAAEAAAKDFHDVGGLSEALASIRHGAEGGARRMAIIQSGKSSNHATARIGLVIGSGNVRPDAWKEAGTSSTTSQSSWYNRIGSLP